MCLQISPLSESLGTVTAVVIFLSCMDLHVGIHVALLSEALATHLDPVGVL